MGKKSILMTPDPYHVPGYCGYVPQFKYKLGETFGAHTHKLLTDDSVASSQHSVLASDQLPQVLPPKTQADFFSSPVYDNFHRLGNQKYMPQMVPGYTGYIPKALGCYGNRYAESCHFAISNFKSDQSKHENKREDMRTNRHVQFPTAPPTPLRPVAPKADAYLPQLTRRHTVSPLSLPDGHPGRHFISGYTGFVPKQQHYIGQGYPIITRQALGEHSGDCRRLEELLDAPVVLHRPPKWVKPSPLLYKKGQGLLPRYTGHIPGQRYKFGMTFGTSTNRAVSEIA